MCWDEKFNSLDLNNGLMNLVAVAAFLARIEFPASTLPLAPGSRKAAEQIARELSWVAPERTSKPQRPRDTNEQ